MKEFIKVYKDDTLLSKTEKLENGKFEAYIFGLKPNTEYSAGEFKVSFENLAGESEKVDVPAFKTEVQRVGYVFLSTHYLDLDVGSTKRLTANVYPTDSENKAVTYTSSDENIATVTNKGTVKGISKGKVTITVTTEDGNYTDTARVDVNEVINTES